MFRFSRQLILPLFLQRRMTISDLAATAGVAYQTAARAVQGLPISAKIVDKVAAALEIDALGYLSPTND